MNHLERGYKTVQDNAWIWLVPLALALGSFFWVTSMGLWPIAKAGGFMKFTIPTGLPSMAQVIDTNQVPLMGGSRVALTGFFAALVGFAFDAFVSGAWLQGVFALLRGESVTMESLLDAGLHYWLRLLIMRVLNLAMLTLVVLPLAAIFPPLAFLGVLALMFYTFFWQLAIVRDDQDVWEGLTRGWAVLSSNISLAFSVAFVIGLLSLGMSIIVHMLAQTMATFPFGAVLWSFVGSVFSVAICSLYDHMREPLV